MRVKCDACPTYGHVRRGTLAPAGWLYQEILIEGEEGVLYACSEKCTSVSWKKGPGVMGTIEEDPGSLMSIEQGPDGEELLKII